MQTNMKNLDQSETSASHALYIYRYIYMQVVVTVIVCYIYIYSRLDHPRGVMTTDKLPYVYDNVTKDRAWSRSAKVRYDPNIQCL